MSEGGNGTYKEVFEFYKGDAGGIEFTLNSDLGETFSNFEIRATIYDKQGDLIKKGNLNVIGGNDSQIKITDVLGLKFEVYLAADDTKHFADKSFLEVKLTTPSGKPVTKVVELALEDPVTNWEDVT